MTASQQASSPFRQTESTDAESARRSDSDERSEADESVKVELGEEMDGTFAPILAPTADDERMQKLHSTNSRPIERSWSLNDGYSCHTADEETAENTPVKEGRDMDESSAFIVTWDENDPVNPRNFNTLRRWLIVIICSLGSLCVVAGGTVGDLFARHELSAPMMLYTASPFVGPEVGPLVGGFINQFTAWRWTFYVLIIWTGVLLISIICLVPETYHPVLLRRKAEKLREETGDDRWEAPIEKLNRSVARTVLRSTYRPVLLLTLEPMCFCLCIFSAILLGIIYLFFGAFQLVFGNVYGLELWQRGLCFLGLFVGMVFAILSDPFWRRVYQRLEEKHKRAGGTEEDFQPEWRLPPAILGGPLVTIGLFFFSWTIYSHVHWIVPIIGSAFFGAGTILVYSGIFTFLVDAYPIYAASALAANSFARSSFGGIFPLFGIQMYNNLGYHWASSLMAFLTLAMAPFPSFLRYRSAVTPNVLRACKVKDLCAQIATGRLCSYSRIRNDLVKDRAGNLDTCQRAGSRRDDAVTFRSASVWQVVVTSAFTTETLSSSTARRNSTRKRS
ncbi:hypothetical protein BBP40_010369 [Aspergillus hancockii]|nr:hypothetical protein BBP40_010369 [Aspergillus hancockii]